MKPWSQVLVTLALVLVALFVYDQVRSAPAVPSDAPDAEVPRSDAATSPLLEPPPLAAVLEGTGDELWRARIERRLDEIEVELARLEGRSSPTESEIGDTESMRASDTSAMEDLAEGAVSDGVQETSPEDVAEARRQALQRFRAMLEAVERQRAREAAVAKIAAFFGKIDLALSDEQRRRAVAVTLDYQGRWAKVAGAPAKTEEEIEARRAAFTDLWGEYGRALEDVIPRAESDKILAALRQIGAQGK